MKKLLVVLAMSIGGTAVFAQDAATEVSKVETQAVPTKGGKLMHKLQVTEAITPSIRFPCLTNKSWKRKKRLSPNDALLKSAVEQKARIKSEEK
jgi:hypothetical protein